MLQEEIEEGKKVGELEHSKAQSVLVACLHWSGEVTIWPQIQSFNVPGQTRMRGVCT